MTAKSTEYKPSLPITITEARQILGNTAKGLSDRAIKQLIVQIDVLTDVIVMHSDGSKIQSELDKSRASKHTGS